MAPRGLVPLSYRVRRAIRMRNGTSSSSTPAGVTLLGIPGLRVHEVWELHAERVLLVDSPPRSGVCTGCGQRAESKGRATVQLRDLPAAGKATRLVWVKGVWRCGDCRVSWRERHPGLPSRSVLTARARLEAARQVGELGRAVAAVARDFGVGWETITRAVADEAGARFADQAVYTIQTRQCLAIGVDEKVMNRGRRALRRRRRFVSSSRSSRPCVRPCVQGPGRLEPTHDAVDTRLHRR